MSFIHTFRSLKIDGRCIIQVKNSSPLEQPIYLKFGGDPLLNHLFTIPASKSFTVVLEATGELHFSQNVNIEIKEIETYCRFDFNVINESQIFELPKSPEYLRYNVTDYHKTHASNRELSVDGELLRISTGTSSNFTAFWNTKIGDVRSFEWTGQMKNTEDNPYAVQGMFSFRDHLSVVFGDQARISLKPIPGNSIFDIRTAPEYVEYAIPNDIYTGDSRFKSWTNFKVRCQADQVYITVWSPGVDEPPSQISVDINDFVTFPDGVTAEDMFEGSIGLCSGSQSGSQTEFKNMLFTYLY